MFTNHDWRFGGIQKTMIIEIAEILIVIGLALFGITAFIKWIDILIECFTLDEYLEGFCFLGIGIFFIGAVLSFLFSVAI